MVKTYSRSKAIQFSEIESKEFPKIFENLKKRYKSTKLDLILWNLMNKFPIQRFFSVFVRQCASCGRKFSEIFIDYYIYNKVICKKCKYKTIFYSKIISFVLNAIVRNLKIPKNKFPEILKENEPLKRK